MDVDQDLLRRFRSYAEGEGEFARVRKEGLRNVLECTDSFCLTKHWLPDAYVDSVYAQYSTFLGIGFAEFSKLERDRLLLEGHLKEYEQVFNSVDKTGIGVISRDNLCSLFEELGRTMSGKELNAIANAADVGHDGIDFADFLGLARTHLDLSEVLGYIAKHELSPVDSASPSLAAETKPGDVILVDKENDLQTVLASGADVIVQLAFSWCRPCKFFAPKYQKLAKKYSTTRFLKIFGNENEFCKHYAVNVLGAKTSPVFAAYSKGQLISTWTGAYVEKFVENIEASLPTAGNRAKALAAAIST